MIGKKYSKKDNIKYYKDSSNLFDLVFLFPVT